MRVEKLQTLDCFEFDKLVKEELDEDFDFLRSTFEPSNGGFQRYSWEYLKEGPEENDPCEIYAHKLFKKGIFSKSMDVIVWVWW